jgi:hypothetical protein
MYRCVLFPLLIIKHILLIVPYVVGSNPNSPVNPYSAMASGGNNTKEIDTSPPKEAYVLYGAVVGGPDQNDRFYDIRSDWPETEVRVIASCFYRTVNSVTTHSCLWTPNAMG